MRFAILRCIENDLEQIFGRFYQKMLSNKDFAVFFESGTKIEELIEKQKSYFSHSLSLTDDELQKMFVELGQHHYDLRMPYVDFSAALTILEENILFIAAQKPEADELIEAVFAFFRLIRGFTAKGFLNRMLANDADDIDLYLAHVARSTEIDTYFVTEQILWLRQLLHAIQTEDRSAVPSLQLPTDLKTSIEHAAGRDDALLRYIDDTIARIEIDATNAFYFIEKQSYEEVLSLYRELMNMYKLSLMLTNVVTIASSNSLICNLSRDALTGLLTRTSLTSIISRELAIASSSNYPVSLIVLDIDHFKRINDNHGHNAGDEVLSKVADILHESIRATDFAFRYGGEEFLLVLKGASEKICAAQAETMRREIERTVFCFDDHEVTVTASFGIATFRRPFNSSFADMFKLADDRLYHSKRNGRNRITN